MSGGLRIFILEDNLSDTALVEGELKKGDFIVTATNPDLVLADYRVWEALTRSNKELEQFASIASHDLQEPLRKLSSFVELLKENCSKVLEPQNLDYLNRMEKSVERMRQLINDLLEYSRVATKGQAFIPLNLKIVLDDALSDLEFSIAKSGGQVEVGALPIVLGDKTLIGRLFENLIGNALKFHKPGLPPHVKIESRKGENEFVEITIQDNGIGFDEKYLDRIFKPVQRLPTRDEFQGTGMGLAICQKIVERHGGTITAKSKPGEGSTFIITLPIA